MRKILVSILFGDSEAAGHMVDVLTLRSQVISKQRRNDALIQEISQGICDIVDLKVQHTQAKAALEAAFSLPV